MTEVLKIVTMLAAASLMARAAAAKTAGTPEGPPPGGGRILPYAIHTTTLANGLKVIVVPYESPGLVAYWTVVRAGSRDEVEPGLSGFAHFFEHMMFRGTERYSREKYNDVLKALGAEHNAFTSDDLTAYHILAPSSALDTLMTIESDRFMNLKYPVEDFRKEAGAVLGEYNKNATNPFRRLQEALREAAFTKHTYRHTTIGFLKDIKNMPNQYEYSRRFFDRFYRPEHCMLLVVGDAKPEEVFALAKERYGGWKRGTWKSTVAAEPEQKREKRIDVPWPVATQTHLYAGYHVPGFSLSSPELPALDIVAELLFSEAAPLYQKLVVDEQVVDILAGGVEDHRDPYLFTWVARLKKDADAARVEAAITGALDAMTRDLVPEERLARVRSHLKAAFAMRLDTPSATAGVLARFLALAGDPEAVNRVYAMYDTVTPEQIREAARRAFTPGSRTIATLRKGSEEKAPRPAGSGG
jgi:zinc protease